VLLDRQFQDDHAVVPRGPQWVGKGKLFDVLTLPSRKGGCGKTVLAMVIAAALAEQGGDVALLDADSNGSAYRWATDILHAPTIHADAERLADLLPSLAERHAGVVVDTAGFGNQAATVAAAAADLVLMPVSHGEADVWRCSGPSPMSQGWRAARVGQSRCA
jgi:cellulose biosynthesis protein BcsQ